MFNIWKMFKFKNVQNQKKCSKLKLFKCKNYSKFQNVQTWKLFKVWSFKNIHFKNCSYFKKCSDLKIVPNFKNVKNVQKWKLFKVWFFLMIRFKKIQIHIFQTSKKFYFLKNTKFWYKRENRSKHLKPVSLERRTKSQNERERNSLEQ
jgi:hypothetical protein